jgi:hypothetical protein
MTNWSLLAAGGQLLLGRRSGEDVQLKNSLKLIEKDCFLRSQKAVEKKKYEEFSIFVNTLDPLVFGRGRGEM